MRKCILICTVLLSHLMASQEVQLSWEKDLNIAKELAKSEDKPILVYFTKSDCKECQQFYGDFFKQESFNGLLDNFILLMLDGSNNDMKTTDIAVVKQRRLVMHYNKSSTFPAVMVLDQDGQEMGALFTSKDLENIKAYRSFLETL